MKRLSRVGRRLLFQVAVVTGILALALLAFIGRAFPAAQAQGANEFFVTDFYAPTGWMLNGVTTDRFAFVPTNGAACLTANTCYKIIWRQPQPIEWVGMYWLHPQAHPSDWAQPGQPGCDFTGATAVTFWARGEQGGEEVAWLATFNALNEIETAPVTLSTTWAPYTIDLSGRDLTNVVGAFGYRIYGSLNSGDTTFYLDRIVYQGVTAAQIACTQNPTATPTTQAAPTTQATPTPTSTASATPTTTTPVTTPIASPVASPPAAGAPLILVYAVLDNNLVSLEGSDNWERLINNLEVGVRADINVRLLIDAAGPGNSYVYDLVHDINPFCPSLLDMSCGARYMDGGKRTVWTEDTAQPASLYSFVADSLTRYPNSARLVLSLVGHGNGWSANALPSLPTRWSDQGEQIGGFLWDDTVGDAPTGTRSLSTKALGAALEQTVDRIGRKFDLLYLDACSMGMAEVAYELRMYADFLLASPNTAWASFPYDKLLQEVDAVKTGQALGKKWLDVEAQALRNNANHPFTLSLVNLAKMDQVIATANGLAGALTNAVPAQRQLIEQSAAAAARYESNYNGALDTQDVYADFYSFSTELLARFGEESTVGRAAITLQSAINDAIEYKDVQAGSPAKFPSQIWAWKNYSGLAIYLPLPVNDSERRLLYTAANLKWAGDGQWEEFLSVYWPPSAGRTHPSTVDLPICGSTGACDSFLAKFMLPISEPSRGVTNWVFVPLLVR